MSFKANYKFDLLNEAEKVRAQIENGNDPVVQARDMISNSILTFILLALSDAGFYEYLSKYGQFRKRDLVENLSLDEDTLSHILDYLLGCKIFELKDENYTLTARGEILFNSYTRGVVNIYFGAYKNVITDITSLLNRKTQLSDPRYIRSTPHAAAGTAFATCAFTIPHVLQILKKYNFNSILDLGCGTGDFLSQILRLNEGLTGYGVDMSSEALDIAKQNAEKFKLDDRLKFYTAEVGVDTLPLEKKEFEEIQVITSMYMLHEFGRDGEGRIVDVLKTLKEQFRGKYFLTIEVEDFDVDKDTGSDLKHFGRLDYRLIHYLSLQGLPRSQKNWHQIFQKANCEIIEPGLKSGGSFVYIVKF